MTKGDYIGDLIREHYAQTGKHWPTPEEALLWCNTEIGEAADLLLMKDPGKWVRNNPHKEQYTDERFCEELGDAIMMLIVAGLVTGSDNPLRTMVAKLETTP